MKFFLCKQSLSPIFVYIIICCNIIIFNQMLLLKLAWAKSSSDHFFPGFRLWGRHFFSPESVNYFNQTSHKVILGVIDSSLLNEGSHSFSRKIIIDYLKSCRCYSNSWNVCVGILRLCRFVCVHIIVPGCRIWPQWGNQI